MDNQDCKKAPKGFFDAQQPPPEKPAAAVGLRVRGGGTDRSAVHIEVFVINLIG